MLSSGTRSCLICLSSHGASLPIAAVMSSLLITRRPTLCACMKTRRNSLSRLRTVGSEVGSICLLARLSIASVATWYRSATDFGISRPTRTSAIEASIESINGLDVMRRLSPSSGSRSQMYRHTSAAASGSRFFSTWRCCSSLSGCREARRNARKHASSKPFGRDSATMTWPCGTSVRRMCRSKWQRNSPHSSSPSSMSTARRLSIACRSMRTMAGCVRYSTCTKASTQFHAESKISWCSASLLCHSWPRTRIGTSEGPLSAVAFSSRMSLLVSVVLPAAGPAVMSKHGCACMSPRV
mmetsp:Transcript_28599/g.87505  ORF Transcript_28599/g.87505 Transcript_28599/m.87505 type:complete len:297 (-) Transcript_28599:2237-3127(-)